MTPDLLKRYAAPVPRYTSYPTAPNFSASVGVGEQRAWLAAIPAGSALSLYVHIPFCTELCWYCGCSTKATRRYEPVAAYLAALQKEIAAVAGLVPKPHRIAHIHWGGGSPNTLSADDIGRLAATISQHFTVADDVEFAVEVDPRVLGEARIAAFAAAGVNRVSIGVQDFDARVQAAINRFQSFERTAETVRLLRAHGVPSINVDLVYGLPHQTRQSADATIAEVLRLDPDRIAIFGYAHLPQRFAHQRQIADDSLPDAVERYAQASRLARRLEANGYHRIGLDHFAKATDTLAQAPLTRNFQGYTTDSAETLIGLGASAISRLPAGFLQNAAVTPDYMSRVAATGLATVRGVSLKDDDRVRAFVIERLMCDLAFSKSALRGAFGASAEPVIEEADALVESDTDRLIERTSDGFKVTAVGRAFIRSICACFDSYLDKPGVRYSVGV